MMPLAICGGLSGLLLAACVTQAIRAYAPTGIPRLVEARIDSEVALFALGVTVFTALVASLWPTLEFDSMRAGSRLWTSVSTRRARDLLVVGSSL
jgi:hypothetical protein